MTMTRAIPDANGMALYKALFGKTPRRVGELDRSSLPSPLTYLTEHHVLTARPRGNWTMIRCPAHNGGGERRPSMIVSLVDGHYKCQACGTKGGDIVALHRLLTGMGFREAVVDLGGRIHD